MTKVLFLEEANVELSEAIDYYENIYPGLGLDFENEIKDLVFRISKDPEL